MTKTLNTLSTSLSGKLMRVAATVPPSTIRRPGRLTKTEASLAVAMTEMTSSATPPSIPITVEGFIGSLSHRWQPIAHPYIGLIRASLKNDFPGHRATRR